MKKTNNNIEQIPSTTNIPYNDEYCQCDKICPHCGKKKNPQFWGTIPLKVLG